MEEELSWNLDKHSLVFQIQSHPFVRFEYFEKASKAHVGGEFDIHNGP